MNDCHCIQNKTNDGSSQWQRYLKALDPSYIKIDDRSIEELLVYTKHLAAQVKFKESNAVIDNENPSNWLDFFSNDLSVVLASISTYYHLRIKREYEAARNQLENQPNDKYFSALFHIILKLVIDIDTWYNSTLPGYPLRAKLELAIGSQLKVQLAKMQAYEEDYRIINSKFFFNLDYNLIQNEELWTVAGDSLYEASIFNGENKEDKILNASLYVDDIFNVVYGFIRELIAGAEVDFIESIDSFPYHKPHIGLFIAFLQLFQIIQEQTNELTERMLQFYYRDVLHLENKAPISDKAHVIFELAKDVSDFNIKEGTLLKAGKDQAGKDLNYKTTHPLVVNQAKIKRLETTYLDKDVSDDGEETIVGYYSRPIANSKDGYGEAFDQHLSIWPTFGEGPNDNAIPNNICEKLRRSSEHSRIDKAKIGFAIASPQLLLHGGNRIIILKHKGLSQLLAKNKNAFSIQLTSTEEWLKVDQKLDSEKFSFIFDKEKSHNLRSIRTGYVVSEDRIAILLGASAPSIIAYDSERHVGPVFKTSFPLLSVGFEGNIGSGDRELTIDDLSIEVQVGSINGDEKISPNMDGLRNLILQNNDSIIDPSKVFHPFTAYPGPGKSLYIGSDEIANKNIKVLSINIENTIDEAKHGEGIELKEDVNKIVVSGIRLKEFAVSILKSRLWNKLSTNDGNNFHRGDLSRNILNRFHQETKELKPIETSRKPLGLLSKWNNSVLKGFIRLDNLKDPRVIFQNDKGNLTYFQKSQEMAPVMEIKNLSVSYIAVLNQLEEGTDQFFHVYPNGIAEIQISKDLQYGERLGKRILNPQGIQRKTHHDPLKVSANKLLLPRFGYSEVLSKLSAADKELIQKRSNQGDRQFIEKHYLELSESNISQYTTDMQEEGILSIGIEGAKPLSILSMLFHFADGSAGNEDNDSPAIHWSFLSNNHWRSLPSANLISDETHGFQATGIIKIKIPESATINNTIKETGLIWLQGSVTQHAERIPKLINVFTQAATTELLYTNNDNSHYENALAPDTINSLKIKSSEIKSVKQPFASYDGKRAEEGEEFYTRVSERLRHKGRAITTWDYEHLILNRFPNIYKVKALSHSDPNCLCRKKDHSVGSKVALDRVSDAICCGGQIAPGHVLLIPISKLKNRNSLDPLKPKTGRRTLLAIEHFIKKRVSPFVKVYAKNPVYEEVITSFKVKFYNDYDSGYHLEKLNKDLLKYLTPWAYNDSVEISFSQKIYASSIINFIEELPYVDYITDFLMGICKVDCCPTEKKSRDGSVEIDLENVSNCDDIEHFLNHDSNLQGQIFIQSCNPRAIIVSVPQHHISLYVEQPQLSPCERRENQEMNINRGKNSTRAFQLKPLDKSVMGSDYRIREKVHNEEE